MRINTNISALNSHRNMTILSGMQSKTASKLSSGLRINTAADDAAGLAISEKMRAQIRGLNMASRNSLDGISLVQTADGSLNEICNILQRIRELVIQSGNGTYTPSDLDIIGIEIGQLALEITSTAEMSQFNMLNLLNFSEKAEFILQVGANFGQTMTIEIDSIAEIRTLVNAGEGTYSTIAFLNNMPFGGMLFARNDANQFLYKDGSVIHFLDQDGELVTTPGPSAAFYTIYDFLLWNPLYRGDLDQAARQIYGFGVGVSVPDAVYFGSTMEEAGDILALFIADNLAVTMPIQPGKITSIINVDTALDVVNTIRAKLGAYQNRLEHKIRGLDITSENLSASESRIRDADMAREMMNLTKANILFQAAVSTLAQANLQPRSVLELLRY